MISGVRLLRPRRVAGPRNDGKYHLAMLLNI
jgi:hypothetical protein